MRPVTMNVYFLRALLVLLLVAAGLLLAHPAPAAARTIVDAHCDQGSGAFALQGNKKYAESFTVGHRGKLTKVFVEPYNAGTFTLEIWDADLFGIPTGTSSLASTTVTNPHSGYEFLTGIFPTPLTVTVSKNYTLVVTVPNAATNGITVTPGNPCADTFSKDQSGSGGFAADTNTPSRDMEFATYMTFKQRHHHR